MGKKCFDRTHHHNTSSHPLMGPRRTDNEPRQRARARLRSAVQWCRASRSCTGRCRIATRAEPHQADPPRTPSAKASTPRRLSAPTSDSPRRASFCFYQTNKPLEMTALFCYFYDLIRSFSKFAFLRTPNRTSLFF